MKNSTILTRGTRKGLNFERINQLDLSGTHRVSNRQCDSVDSSWSPSVAMVIPDKEL